MEYLLNILKLIISYMLIFYLYILIKKNLIKDVRDNDVILIKNGRINFRELVSKKCSISYILKKLREDNIKEIESIDCAILSKDGDILLYSKYESDSVLTLVIDGEINVRVLRQLRRKREWIDNILDNKNVELKDVSFAFLLNNSVYIIKKEA